MSPLPRRGGRRAVRPSWADHVPRRRLLPGGSPARRSAAAVLTATALLGVGTWTTVTTAARAPAAPPVTVLGLTANGTCDNRKAARQHAAATDTRTQARALLTDLTLSADPADHALADQITELGFRPATQPPGWRQHAVDVADHLHHLTSGHPQPDSQLSEVGVRLAAAGLGPTPADLINPPPAADLIDDTAAGADAALGAVDQALAAATTPPPAAATPPVERPRSAAPPIPATCTDHHPATPTASPEQPPAEEKNAPDPGPADAPAPATSAAALPTVTAPTATPATPATPLPTSTTPEPSSDNRHADNSQTATPPAPATEPPAPAVSVNNIDADTQTGPSPAASTADDEKAQSAIGMVTDLLSALTADGDTDATQIGTTLLDTLDRDRLAALGADPDDLDTLDHLRSLGSGRSDETRTGPRLTGGDQSSAAGTGSTPPPTPALEQLSSGESEVRPGEVITRTQSTQPSRATTDTASGAASSAGQHTSTSATPETSTSRAGSVAADIEKLRAQARAAAEADPLAQDLLDALDRTTSTGATGRTVSAGERSGRPTSDNDPNKDSDTVSTDLTGGADDRARHQPDTPRPATPGPSAKKPATGSGAEPPPATGDAETGPATDSTFDNLAQCESGGDWATNTGNGYHGGLQFSPSTWRAFGGQGAAHEASRDEQIAVAKRVQAVQGWAAWPACSQRLGLR